MTTIRCATVRKAFDTRRKAGLRSSAPGKAFHIDVMEFRLGDLILHLYLVVDNFSRMILAWRLDEKLSATVRLESVIEAFRRAKIIRPDFGESDEILLVSDGGPENKFALDPRDEFFANVRRVTAQVDISSSNSMAESANQRIRSSCRYFPNEMRNNLGALIGSLIEDQNTRRPQAVLSGFTPMEVFTGKVPDKNRFREAIGAARLARIEKNRVDWCGKCDF